jgi:VCBS repeat-containing protein
VADNAGDSDFYDGNFGSDTLKIVLTQAEAGDAGIQADIAAFQNFLVANSNPGSSSGAIFQFASFDLRVRNFETLVVSVEGGGQQPPIASDDAGASDEDTSVLIAVLGNDNDPDGSNLNLQVIAYDDSTLAGSLILNPDNTFTYTPGAAFQSLAAGQNAVESFTYTVQDEQGLTDTATVTITILGTNDGAIIGGVDTGAVKEDVALSASGTLTISDIDTGEAAFIATTGIAGSYGTLDIDAAGNWTYTVYNSAPAIQELAAGALLEDTVQVASVDGTPHDIQITIEGTNDGPIVDAA